MIYEYNEGKVVRWFAEEKGEKGNRQKGALLGEWSLADLSEDQRQRMALWGLHHSLRNAIAGAKKASDEEKIAIAEAQFMRIRYGEKAGAIPAWLPAALQRAKALESEQKALELLLSADSEAIKKIAVHPDILRAKAQIELERAQAAEAEEVDDLDSLF